MTEEQQLDPLALALAADLAHRLGIDTQLPLPSEANIARRAVWHVASVQDTAVPAVGASVPVRIYHPSPATDLPALLYIHGGGWFSGCLDDVDANCRELCARSQCVVISISYSLSPEHKFPHALGEVDAVCRWVYAMATTLRVDRRRMAIGGESAGATLAAAQCLLLRNLDEPRLILQLLIYPVLDPEMDRDELRDNRDPILSTGLIRAMWRQYTDAGTDWDNELLAPLRASCLADLPAAVLVTAGTDPLRIEGKAFALALISNGVAVNHVHAEGLFHGFFGMAHPRAQEVMNEVVGALTQAFSQARAARPPLSEV